ncbi:DUF2637 domain-containing protein [Mycolicibacter senuensis]|uniref:DUF2637 domain-containing protein n=1 Tax=Mycolicibacter senuensis TaxID=386913 RepID=A0A7I9XR17_9MYCO|nr:DUF2637 domain-containing protein [Mycolicibacter senuensis]GFG71846.1 hypothetical protein MSEN_35660 [Mycolicibacter senuensis]
MNAHQAARRFFWAWLIGAAAVSVCGVVAHAMLGDARSPVIASALATVVVAIQLCATYGVHALVQAQITGSVYRCALAAAGLLAAGAFAVNFVALRDLALTQASIDPAIAWIVPLIIDLGMTASTIALLALNSQSAAQVHAAAHHADTQPPVHVEVHNTVHNATHADAHLNAAHRIVRQGVVRIAPERVAQVLEAHAAGTAPSTIQRTLKVGYTTVQRIIDHQLQEAT